MSTGSYVGKKRSARGVDHPSPCCAKVEERVEVQFPSGLARQVTGRSLPFFLPLYLSVTALGQPVVPYLEHTDESGDGGHGVQRQFADVDLHDSQVPEFRPRDEHKEQN